MTNRILRSFERLFTGHVFAAYLVAVLVLITTLMIVMLFAPVGETGFGAFAAEFKTWCFNYDPSTGRVDTVYAAVMILNPLMLIGIVGGIWWGTLKRAIHEQRRSMGGVFVAAALSVAALAAGIAVAAPTQTSQANLPFPAERLRTRIEAQDFALQNQEGDTVRLADFRGRVVLLTAVYANCHSACPTIITQAKRAVSELEPELRDRLNIVAITLDPQNDTRERLAATASAHELEAPFFNFVNGPDPNVVERLLDAYSFSRIRNAETGVIDHANMFVLVDRDGLVAYRLNLGERHQNWLTQGLTVLLREVDESPSTNVVAVTAEDVQR